MAVSKAQQKAQNKWIAKAYDRVNLTLPKGRKAELQAHATARGESVNGFINRAIGEAMGRDSAGGPTAAPMGGDGLLITRSTVKAAQEAAQAAGEDLSRFVARAVETQAHRDALARKMDINPTAGGKLETEA